jgi:hypothetical protein
MQQAFSALFLAAGLAGASVLGLIPSSASATGNAVDPVDERILGDLPIDCGITLVHGVYGFNAEGVVKVGPRFDPFIAVGLIDLREDGTAFVSLREHLAGVPEEIRETFQGTWQVDRNCLGTATFAQPPGAGHPDATWDFVAVENGNELYLITTREGVVVHADAKRLFRR